MGAPTSLTMWIPEDDLLLKNAVEAGAPLESLAKGEVHFSCRYTIHELRDRWRALLYDLDTSIQASVRMVEIGIELAASNLPKATRACNPNSKGKESSCRKRKADSVRSHYYAMRKRIRSEPSNGNQNLCVPRALLDANECDKGSREQIMHGNDHPTDNFGLKVPFPDDHVSAQHAFPELMGVDSSAANGNFFHQASHAEHVGSAEDVIPDGTSGAGCLIAYTENISSVPHDEAECNIGNQSFEYNFQQRDFPNILGENLIDSSSEIHDIGQSNALSRSRPYKDDDIGVKRASHFNSSNYNREVVVCANLVKNDNLSPHVTEYGDAFHHPARYSSPPSGMHVWRNMEDNSTTTMPVKGHYGENPQGLHIDGNKNISAPGCDVVSSEPKLDGVMRDAGLNDPTMMPENDFIDFPDAYMDFDHDDSLISMDLIEKDNTDVPCLGLLLNSPGDAHLAVASSNGLGPTNASEACLEIPDAPCSGEPNVLCDQMQHSQLPDDHNNHVSGVNVPYTSSQTCNSVKLRDEFMMCVLNTEDLEIPNNDRVILHEPAFSPFSLNSRQSDREITRFVSAENVMSTNWSDHVGVLNKAEEHVANVQLMVYPLKEFSLCFPKVGLRHSSDGCAVGADPSKDGSMARCPGYACNAVDDTKRCRSEAVGQNSTPVTAFKEESTAPCFLDQDDPDDSFASFLESHIQDSDDDKVHPLNATDSFPGELNMQVGIHTCSPTQLHSREAGFFESQFSDSDEDVPYFSDIEALILDMDLSPYDGESGVFSGKVSRYQHIDIKNTARWEQAFLSHTSRSISSHGAFAVFYGRHLKYYIKDAKVSIGRKTEDMRVDIDLGREGHANKISRRQAIIKLDEKGSFSLKNIGRFSIFVNGKEVPAKRLIKLESHSLVKIQDMHFAFEVNESAVRKYIKKTQSSSQELSAF